MDETTAILSATSFKKSTVLLAAFGIAFSVLGASGCSDRSGSFQTACDHLATAVHAVEEGDEVTAKHELERAYDWVVPAYEDTESQSERDALDDLSIALNAALSDFDTEQGARALEDAQASCS